MEMGLLQRLAREIALRKICPPPSKVLPSISKTGGGAMLVVCNEGALKDPDIDVHSPMSS